MNQTREGALTAQSTEAAELEGRCNIRALEYQNLYMSTKLAGTETPEYLQMPAQEYYRITTDERQ